MGGLHVRRHNLFLLVCRDTLVIGIGNCCTSFFAGFAIFSVLGHMAWRKKVSVGRVADSGTEDVGKPPLAGPPVDSRRL